MISQALFALLLFGIASGFSTDFEKTLGTRIRIYHDAYMRQNFNTRHAPNIRVLRSAKYTHESFKKATTSEDVVNVLNMMIGNGPDSDEFDQIVDSTIAAKKLKRMIRNSPKNDKFERQVDTQNKPLRMMIGNSPDSGEFDEPYNEKLNPEELEVLKTGSYPLRMMIGNSPDSGEFGQILDDKVNSGPLQMMIRNSPDPDEFKRQVDMQNLPLRMMIGNSPDSDESDEAIQNPDELNPNLMKTGSYPVRMMIGNSPDSGEFDQILDDKVNSGPLQMMIRNSPDPDEFKRQVDMQKDEFETIDQSQSPQKQYPLRMMIGNSPNSDEFDQNLDKRDSQPLNMMIRNSPNPDEFNTIDESQSLDQKQEYPLRMMIGNSPNSNEFVQHSDDKVNSRKLHMMIRGSPSSEQLAAHKATSPPSAKNKLCGYSNSCNDTIEWNTFFDLISKDVDSDMKAYYQNWHQIPIILTDELRQQFQYAFPPISIQSAILSMSQTNALLRLFWPFSFDVSLMNQKLGLYGLSGEVHEENIKAQFFKGLNELQGIDLPVAENKVILSFNHPELVDGMNRSSLLQNSHDFINKGKHLFNKTEEKEIRDNVKAAFRLINRVSPSLYRSIKQLISCIAFYKGQDQIHLGGSVSSALGVIWLDPSTNYNWSVPFYAEQIVHEFTHNALFYEELVHGTYTDHSSFSKAKVISAIRRQLRDYDKSFHAAYVSTGLIVFHSKAGYQKRALNLARPLPSSVRDLVEVNKRTRILTHNGEAMLQTLVDFLTLARIPEEAELL